MTPKTPLQLLAGFTPAGPMPANGSDRAKKAWLNKVRRNLKGVVAFTQYELVKHTSADTELYNGLIHAKKQSLMMLHETERYICNRTLRNSKALTALRRRYDTLNSSVGRIFLLLDPELAARAERAL